MARDDLEYLSLIDFTPGVYSKYGAVSSLGKDGAARVDDGTTTQAGLAANAGSQPRHTYGCYGDPDGGLRPLPRLIRQYTYTTAQFLLDQSGVATPFAIPPTTRALGSGDGGRRAKVGIIDAASHPAERYESGTYDASPYLRDRAGAERSDMVHMLFSFRQDPVDLVTDATSRFPALGRLRNFWTAFDLSDYNGNVDLSNYNIRLQVRANRYEEGSAGSGVGITTGFPMNGLIVRAAEFDNWRYQFTRLHDGWAAGTIAIGRSTSEIPGLGVVTLDDIDDPGSLVVVACMYHYVPWMLPGINEEGYANFLSIAGGPTFGFSVNSIIGYPGEANLGTGCVPGEWTYRQVPHYLIEHQDRFVGLINTNRVTIGPGQYRYDNAYFGQSGGGTDNYRTPSNTVRYSELNSALVTWNDTNAGPHDITTGRIYNNTEFWKFTDADGTYDSIYTFGVGDGIQRGTPTNPPADVLGNQLIHEIGCMFSWQNNLIIVPHQGEGSIVSGAMEDPTVTRSSTVHPSKGTVSIPAQTPMGVAYGSRDGVFMWTGEKAEPLSPQLDGFFWDCGTASETHADGYRTKAHASFGRFAFSYPFLYAPNYWVMDIRTGAWFRLCNPNNTNPYPYMHHTVNAQGEVYAVRGCYDAVNTGLMDLYSQDDLATKYRWVSQPILSSINRELDVEQVVLVAQGSGTIRVILQGIDGVEITETFTVTNTAGPTRISKATNMSATELTVIIESEGMDTSTDAPVVHAVHIGSRADRQLPRA